MHPKETWFAVLAVIREHFILIKMIKTSFKKKKKSSGISQDVYAAELCLCESAGLNSRSCSTFGAFEAVL